MSRGDAGARFRQFLASPELGLVSTLAYACLYTWPFLAFDHAGSVFRFVFVVWTLHIAHLALVAILGRDADADVAEENG